MRCAVLIPSSLRPAASAVLLLATAFLTACTPTAKPVDKTRYSFWPQPPDEPRIQFLTSFNAASDVREKKGGGLDELLYGKEQERDVSILKPYGVAMWDGRLYVCDLRGSGMLVLDIRKKESRLMGAEGMGQIKKAVDVAIAPDGTKYVADLARGGVLVFDPAERFIRLFNLPDVNPVALAISGNELFVTDLKGRKIRVLDRTTGKELRSFGEMGNEDGKFMQPLSVATDKQGNLYVTDVVRCRIQRFTRDGAFIDAFGRLGNRAGDFVRPKHVRVASDGTIFVVDAQFSNVQVFDPEGKVMGFFGLLGNHPGAMDLPAGLYISEDPRDIELFAKYVHPAFQSERLIVVTNQFGNNKVAVYAMGHLKPGRSPSELMGVAAPMAEPAPATQPATQPTAPAAK